VFEVEQRPAVHLPFSLSYGEGKKMGRERTEHPSLEPRRSVQVHKLLDSQSAAPCHVSCHHEVGIKTPHEAFDPLQKKPSADHARERAPIFAPAQRNEPALQCDTLQANSPEPTLSVKAHVFLPDEERGSKVDEAKKCDPGYLGQPRSRSAGQAS